MNKPQLMIAATSSGCGKTTFTLGLLRSLQRRGHTLANFKCGPDYIDPKFHELASGQRSINLDQYMMSAQHIQEVYARHSLEASCAVVEGVMGLFDGSVRMQGSSASLAKLLGLPIVLLVNAASSAYSVGATIYGFAHWQPNVRVAGVVFNRVASESHYRFLADAAEDADVPVLGYIPRHSGIEVPSRHLGLSVEELNQLGHFPDMVADLIDQHVDVERLLQLCATPVPELHPVAEPRLGQWSIAVAQDAAFNFIYPENIRALERLGKVEFFSPIADARLPDADMVYLPGGYPEFYLEALQRNSAMRSQLHAYAEAGGRILAECGGMMYLSDAIVGEDGQRYEMCGILPQTATMQGMKLTLGYRSVRTKHMELHGHEFHYSHIVGASPIGSMAQQFNARGVQVDTPLYRVNNVIAGYTHLYWAEQDIRQLWG